MVKTTRAVPGLNPRRLLARRATPPPRKRRLLACRACPTPICARTPWPGPARVVDPLRGLACLAIGPLTWAEVPMGDANKLHSVTLMLGACPPFRLARCRWSGCQLNGGWHLGAGMVVPLPLRLGPACLMPRIDPQVHNALWTSAWYYSPGL